MSVPLGQIGIASPLDGAGHLQFNIPVTILLMDGTTLATLWQDFAGTIPQTNPVSTDPVTGNLLTYLACGRYLIKIGGAIIGPISVNIPWAAVGVVGGIPGPLDAGGLIPLAQIPGGGSGGGSAQFNVKSAPYNAAGNGIVEDTVSLRNATTDALSVGGTVFMPPGLYKCGNPVSGSTVAFTVDKPNTSVIGCGASSTFLAPYNNAETIRIRDASFVPEHSFGTFGGFSIDGVGAGSAACGVHMGDAMSGKLSDLRIANFIGATAKGLWLDNVAAYTERWKWDRVNIVNCNYGVLFDINGGGSTAGISNSFGYHTIDRLHVVVASGQYGVVLRNGALLYNAQVGISGNMAAGGTFITIAGIAGVGVTQMAGCGYTITAEVTGGGSAGGIVLVEYGAMRGGGTVDCSSGTLVSANGATHPGVFDLEGYIQLGTGAVGATRSTGTVTTTVGAAGSSSALPATPAFMVDRWINGVRFKEAIYNP